MQVTLRAPNARVVRALGGVAVAAVLVHFLVRVWMLSEGRYFATEDDGYRAYYGYLSAEGTASVISRFWLPGQFFALGLVHGPSDAESLRPGCSAQVHAHCSRTHGPMPHDARWAKASSL